MKLVVDNSNVETIPVENLNDIAAQARKFAEEVDAGEIGEIVSVTLLIETATDLKRESWGEMPSRYELIGILETAKMATIADDVIED